MKTTWIIILALVLVGLMLGIESEGHRVGPGVYNENYYDNPVRSWEQQANETDELIDLFEEYVESTHR